MKVWLALLLCGLAVASCSAPYQSPMLDAGGPTGEPVARFDGVRGFVSRGHVRMLWVHGMCTHRRDWAVDRAKLLMDALGHAAALPGGTHEGPHTLPLRTKIDGHELSVDFIIWSPLTADAKARLRFDAPISRAEGEFAYERSKLNGELKTGLINDCLTDAVVYSSPAGDAIREFMKGEVCRSLSGDLRGPRCEIRKEKRPVQTILVAESLGSKLLFDAIRDLWSGSSGVSRQQLASHLGSVQTIFLLANQIPLLDAGTRSKRVARSTAAVDAAASTMTRGISTLRAARVARPGHQSPAASPLQVVAFTDPNDLLSYRLTRTSLSLDGAQIANLIVSNDTTYLGMFELPNTAHCGYDQNPHVVGYLIDGFQGVAAKPIPRSGSKNCGL